MNGLCLFCFYVNIFVYVTYWLLDTPCWELCEFSFAIKLKIFTFFKFL